MKILHLINTINPVFGGPSEGVRNMGLMLLEFGHSVEIATLDAPDSPWFANFVVPIHALGPSHLNLYSFTPRLLPWLRKNARQYDKILVHGLWQYSGLAAWLTGTSYHIYVHGMLDPWFRYAYPLKHIKKWLYWLPIESNVLKNAESVLFTTEEEKSLARQSFELYKANEKVVGYGISAPPSDKNSQIRIFLDAFPELAKRKIILYLGRIDHKKGCGLLIKAFSNLSTNHPEWTLVMAGPDLKNIRSELGSLVSTNNIIWTGMLTGAQKWGAFRAASVFVLPSHSENFGIAVAEALACGTPVLISNKVNIWREIEQAGAGLVAPDTLDGTIDLLERWFSLGEDGQAQLASQAVSCFEQNFEINTNIRRLLDHLENSKTR